MSKECITGCWRIKNLEKSIESDNFLAGPMAIHPDFFSSTTDVDKLLEVCEASYDCNGPGVTEVDVTKGWIRKRTETKTVATCGLPNSVFES